MRTRVAKSTDTERRLRAAHAMQAGFTVIELLIVLIIISILAAIAVPSLFNQRDKAKDAKAKEQVFTARTALESFSVDNGGFYSGATAAALRTIEGTLNELPLLVLSTTNTTYKLQVTAETGAAYDLEVTAAGARVRTCAPAGEGGCGADGTW